MVNQRGSGRGFGVMLCVIDCKERK